MIEKGPDCVTFKWYRPAPFLLGLTVALLWVKLFRDGDSLHWLEVLGPVLIIPAVAMTVVLVCAIASLMLLGWAWCEKHIASFMSR